MGIHRKRRHDVIPSQGAEHNGRDNLEKSPRANKLKKRQHISNNDPTSGKTVQERLKDDKKRWVIRKRNILLPCRMIEETTSNKTWHRSDMQPYATVRVKRLKQTRK